MYYKPDWEQAKRRLIAFWNGEITDRCCVGVLAPRKGSRLPPFPELQHGPWLGGLESLDDNDSDAIRSWWTSPEKNYERMILWFENTFFGGEATPITYINWGAMAEAAFYGSPPLFSKTTVWYPEVVENWDTWKWSFDEGRNMYWGQTLDITRCLLERNGGRYFVGTAEMGHAADVLSLMRGTETLCLDMIEKPQAIKDAIEVLSDTRIRLHKMLYELTKGANDNGGVIAWMNLWAPDRLDQAFCDFSSIISPTAFSEFFVPEIKKVLAGLSCNSYHLDGPDAMRSHLTALLEVDEIRNIQWTPGTGLPPTYSPQYLPVYKRIQERGKSLYLLAKIQEIEPLLAELSPKGLFLCTSARSEEEARDLLKKVEKWSLKK